MKKISCEQKITKNIMDIPHTAKSNAACLVSFMSFIDGMDYDTSASFSEEQLLAITANQVPAYLNLKAYGTPTPGPSDRPIHGRSNSLAFQKKAISHFIPLYSMQWDDICQRGNTICSGAVNAVITKVKNTRSDKRALQVQHVVHWSGRSFTCCLFLSVISMQTVICGFSCPRCSVFSGRLSAALMT